MVHKVIYRGTNQDTIKIQKNINSPYSYKFPGLNIFVRYKFHNLHKNCNKVFLTATQVAIGFDTMQS